MGDAVELLVFAVFALFWLLESVAGAARRRRQQQEEAEARPEDEFSWSSDRPGDYGPAGVGEAAEESGPGRAEEPFSWDDAVEREAEPTRTAPDRERRAEEPASGMIPGELWREIEAMMRGELPSTPFPRPPVEPAPARPSPPLEPVPTASGTSGPEISTGVPGAWAASSARPAADSTPPPLRGSGAGPLPGPILRVGGLRGSSARRALRIGGRQRLREAIVVREVLGPPRALQPDPDPAASWIPPAPGDPLVTGRR